VIGASLKIENSLWQSGLKHILGIDEVGRGSWAGPLVAAGVILPANIKLKLPIADSKKLSAIAREKLAIEIRKIAEYSTITEISHSLINKLGLAKAAQMAFSKVAKSSRSSADFFLIDAFYIKNLQNKKQLAINQGDEISASIAAASIIAKVYRDDLMQKFHNIYPIYNFNKNKGYGTRDHQNAIRKYGFCQIHRTGFNLNYLVS